MVDESLHATAKEEAIPLGRSPRTDASVARDWLSPTLASGRLCRPHLVVDAQSEVLRETFEAFVVGAASFGGSGIAVDRFLNPGTAGTTFDVNGPIRVRGSDGFSRAFDTRGRKALIAVAGRLP